METDILRCLALMLAGRLDQATAPHTMQLLSEVRRALDSARRAPIVPARETLMEWGLSPQEADHIADVLASKVDQSQIDANGTGSMCIGLNPIYPRLALYFSEGQMVGRPHLMIPAGRTQGRPSPHRRRALARILLVNVASSKARLATAPLGIITLGGVLKRRFRDSIQVDYLDLQLERRSKALQEKLANQHYDVIGLSVWSGAHQSMDRILAELETTGIAGNARIVLGSVVPTYGYRSILERYPRLACVLGRGENAMERIAEAALAGEESDLWFSVPGAAFVVGDVLVETAGEPTQVKELGAPDWRGLFARYPAHLYNDIWIESSRGCQQKKNAIGCSFCAIMPNAGSRDWQSREPETVLNEIRELAGHQVRYVRFADEEFMAGQIEAAIRFGRRLNAFRLELEADGLQMPAFEFAIRVDDVVRVGPRQDDLATWSIDGETLTMSRNQARREALSLYVAAGLTTIFLGFDSGSAAQLRRFYKGVRPHDNGAALAVARELGLRVLGGWILVDPLMPSLDDVHESLAFIRENRLVPVQAPFDVMMNPISAIRILEGSPFVGLLRREGLLRGVRPNYTEHWFEYRKPEVAALARALRQWDEMAPAMIDNLQRVVTTEVLPQRLGHPLDERMANLNAFRVIDMACVEELLTLPLGTPGIQEQIDAVLGRHDRRRQVLAQQLEQALTQVVIRNVSQPTSRVRPATIPAVVMPHAGGD